MPADLSSYPLSANQLSKLHANGFVNSKDVLELTATELSKELQITSTEALDIRNAIKGDIGINSYNKSAYELMKEEEKNTPIVTFCAALDEIIGGGIPIGKITEFCGAPGMGKTQFGIQLSVDAQIPELFGGVEGEACYIDCEGSFVCERVVEIADAACKHINNVAETDKEVEAARRFNFESVLRGIHTYRCHDYVQLIALSHLLPEFIIEHPKVKIIILDSIAFHFRHDFEDLGLRTRLLHGLVQSFMKIAHEHKLAVVFMNQMTTKISPTEESRLIPALGQSWGHACTVRIILNSRNGQRYAQLFKSPCQEEATIPFDIVKEGIRDVHTADETINKSVTSLNDSKIQQVPENKPPKRMKIES